MDDLLKAMRWINTQLDGALEDALSTKASYQETHRQLVRENRANGMIFPALVPRVRQGPQGAVHVWWERQAYATNNGGRPVAQHIKKNKNGVPYPKAKLQALVDDWEIDVVWETEQRFESLRAFARDLLAARIALEKVRTQTGEAK